MHHPQREVTKRRRRDKAGVGTAAPIHAEEWARCDEAGPSIRSPLRRGHSTNIIHKKRASLLSNKVLDKHQKVLTTSSNHTWSDRLSYRQQKCEEERPPRRRERTSMNDARLSAQTSYAKTKSVCDHVQERLARTCTAKACTDITMVTRAPETPGVRSALAILEPASIGAATGGTAYGCRPHRTKSKAVGKEQVGGYMLLIKWIVGKRRAPSLVQETHRSLARRQQHLETDQI